MMGAATLGHINQARGTYQGMAFDGTWPRARTHYSLRDGEKMKCFTADGHNFQGDQLKRGAGALYSGGVVAGGNMAMPQLPTTH